MFEVLRTEILEFLDIAPIMDLFGQKIFKFSSKNAYTLCTYLDNLQLFGQFLAGEVSK